MSEDAGRIVKVSGPTVVAADVPNVRMFDIVDVGDLGLIGEVIRLDGDQAFIQVYEETSGLRLGEAVKTRGLPLSVTLGPGLLGATYDGIQRPLHALQAQSGSFIARGIEAPALDLERKWEFTPDGETG